MAEAEAGEADKGVGIRDDGRSGLQEDDGGIDFGRRMKGGRFDFEQFASLCKNRGLDGQEAVVARAGEGGEAVRHFLLDEEDGADEIEAEDFFHYGRGDVVGEIAGDYGAAPLGEVGREDVAVDELERGEAGAQVAGEIGIEFDGYEAIGAGKEFLGEGAAARADFNDQGFMGGRRGRGDALEDGTADEEVLAETLGHVTIVGAGTAPLRPRPCFVPH